MGKNSHHYLVGEVRESRSMGGLDSRVAPTSGVWWEGYTHRQMWDMVMRSTPDELFARVDRWHAVATTLEEGNRLIQQRLNTLLATWRGPAAEAAAASQQRLLDWAQDAASRASAVGTQLGNYGNALVSARMRMPQPQHRWAELSFRKGDGANALEGTAGAHLLLQMLSDRLPTAQQAREAKQEAVVVMRELEGNGVQAEQAMPRFTSAPTTGSDEPFDPSPRPSPPVDSSTAGRLPTPADTRPAFDGANLSTTAQAVGDPVGHGVGESRGAVPHGGGSAGGQPGLIGRGPLAGSGPLGGVTGQGGLAARAAAAVPGSGFMPGPMGARTDGDEDKEKPLADYLKDDGIFTDDRRVSRPVWGA
jgi:hypothetical protein